VRVALTAALLAPVVIFVQHALRNRATCVIADATVPATVTLTRRSSADAPYAATVTVRGRIDGRGALSLRGGTPTAIEGDVDVVLHKGDWYSNAIVVTYTPESARGGRLRVVATFHTL